MDLPRLSPRVLIRFRHGDLVTFHGIWLLLRSRWAAGSGLLDGPISSSPRATEPTHTRHTPPRPACKPGGWRPRRGQDNGVVGSQRAHMFEASLASSASIPKKKIPTKKLLTEQQGSLPPRWPRLGMVLYVCLLWTCTVRIPTYLYLHVFIFTSIEQSRAAAAAAAAAAPLLCVGP